jgi:hypothetical protein
MVASNPRQQLMHGLGAEDPAEPQPDQDPDQNQSGEDPSEKEARRRLYQSILGTTQDSSDPQHRSSLLDAMAGGESLKLDPAQLRAALALAIAASQKKSARAAAKAGGEAPTSGALWYMLWFVIAVSAGAIAAVLALK